MHVYLYGESEADEGAKIEDYEEFRRLLIWINDSLNNEGERKSTTED